MDFQDLNQEVVEQAKLRADLEVDFLQNEEAKAFCKTMKDTDFGSLTGEFKEAIQFVLENDDPYVCARLDDHLNLIGLTVGRVDKNDKIAFRDWRLVLPSSHRQGVGTAMEKVEKEKLKDMGIKTIYSEAVTDAGKNFLEKRGYKSSHEGWYYMDL